MQSVLMLWALLLCSATAAQTAPVSSATQQVLQDEAAPLNSWLALMFALPDGVSLDPPLRAAATEMAAEHRLRMSAVFTTWVSQERAASGASTIPAQTRLRLHRRLANEVALWKLSSFGPGLDQTLQAAFLKPGVCRDMGQQSFFADQMLWLQALPASQREVALLKERGLLNAWGTARTSLPDWPVLPPESVPKALAQLRSGTARFDPALPPVLAARLLGDEEASLASLPWNERCALNQWWLRVALRKSVALRDQALVTFRYALMPLATEGWTGLASSAASGAATAAQDYPPFASRHGVEGTITVQSVVDMEGRFQRATVVRREVTVDGIRGVRPVAFETVLDEASLARAARVAYPKKTAAQTKDGLYVGSFEIVWKLE